MRELELRKKLEWEDYREGQEERRAQCQSLSSVSILQSEHMCRRNGRTDQSEEGTESINSEHTVRSIQGHREWQSGGNFFADMYDIIWGIPDAFSCVSLGD